MEGWHECDLYGYDGKCLECRHNLICADKKKEQEPSPCRYTVLGSDEENQSRLNNEYTRSG